MRDALEIIDTELAGISADVRNDVEARLRAGGRIVATRNGITTVEYYDDRGRLVAERVATLEDVVPRAERDKARAA